MNRKHRKILELVFKTPAGGNVKWQEAIALLRACGATIDETRSGSRVHIELEGKDLLQHRPHPSPCMDKGAVTSLRKFLELCGIEP
jgi:hypothetical protein